MKPINRTTRILQVFERLCSLGGGLGLLHYKNEAHRQPVLNVHIARACLTATDPEEAKRNW
jgi:hypothetical protein